MPPLQDNLLQQLIDAEEQRQREGLELIPSENYVSRDVLTALGSIYTNKYSEGYPGKRYYGGQENTDQVETLAIERAKALFNADHANVQPHSGAPANVAVYQAWLNPGDTIMAMRLDHGGHLELHRNQHGVLECAFGHVLSAGDASVNGELPGIARRRHAAIEEAVTGGPPHLAA